MRAIFLTLFFFCNGWALPLGDFSVQSDQSHLQFTVVHKFHQVVGKTKKIEGRALVKKESAEAMIRIEAASFDSGNENRDAHMKEVIEAHKFPFIILKAKLVDAEAGNVHVNGTLQFHGVEKPLETKVKLSQEGDRWKAEVHFSFKLSDFNVERPSLLFVKIEDEVNMEGILWFK